MAAYVGREIIHPLAALGGALQACLCSPDRVLYAPHPLSRDRADHRAADRRRTEGSTGTYARDHAKKRPKEQVCLQSMVPLNKSAGIAGKFRATQFLLGA